MFMPPPTTSDPRLWLLHFVSMQGDSKRQVAIPVPTAGEALSISDGPVTGSISFSDQHRIITITAGEGWRGPQWDAVAKALGATEDYLDHDYCELDDGQEQWRIVYRRRFYE